MTPTINRSKVFIDLAHKGKYKPNHPEKYAGDVTDIVYRSAWEFRVMRFLDSNPNVTKWVSESIIIPYVSPVDGKPHRYFPDFLIEAKDGNDQIKTILIEVKPEKQTRQPKAPTKPQQKRRYLKECATYAVNQAKWESARKVAAKYGWEFMILTEKDIYGK